MKKSQKKNKKSKKDKSLNVSNKNNINIKINTGGKRSRNKSKSQPGVGDKKYSQLPQYPTITQYNPVQPLPTPELDYNTLAKHYLKEEPKAVRNHLLLKDADEERPNKPPIKILHSIKKKTRRDPPINIDSYEALMKVKSLKTLKEIFKSEGISEQYYKKLTNKNKEQAIREFLKRNEMKQAGGANPFRSPRRIQVDDQNSDSGNDSDDSLGPFQSQQATSGGGARVWRDTSPVSGDIMNILDQERKLDDTYRQLLREQEEILASAQSQSSKPISRGSRHR